MMSECLLMQHHQDSHLITSITGVHQHVTDDDELLADVNLDGAAPASTDCRLFVASIDSYIIRSFPKKCISI
jgi:hypothetical protein